MAYILSGITVRNPTHFDEGKSTQFAQQRVLSGSYGRDYFGSNKRIWVLNYENAKATDYTIINNIYSTYLSTGTAPTWQVTETNYTVASTTVHMDLVERSFRIHGNDYLSNFTLTLTEV